MLLFLIFFISGYLFFSKYVESLFLLKRENLSLGLISVAASLDSSDLKSLSEQEFQFSEYKKTWTKLKRLQDKLKLSYIYIIIPRELNQFYFAYDTANNPDSFSSKKLSFRKYSDPPLEIYDSIVTDEVVFVNGFQKNQWGVFTSGFYRIQKEGKLVAIIGADLDIFSFLEIKKRSNVIFLLSISLGLIVTLFLFYTLYFHLYLPLNKLSHEIERISNGSMESIVQKETGDFSDLFRDLENIKKQIRAKSELADQASIQFVEKLSQRKEYLRIALASEEKLLQEKEEILAYLSQLASSLFESKGSLGNIRIQNFAKQNYYNFIDQKRFSSSGLVFISRQMNFLGSKHLFFFYGDTEKRYMQGLISSLFIYILVYSLLIKQEQNKRLVLKEADRWLRDLFWQIETLLGKSKMNMHVKGTAGVISQETGKMLFFSIGKENIFLSRDENLIDLSEKFSSIPSEFNSESKYLQNEFQLSSGDILYFCNAESDTLETKEKIDTIVQILAQSKGEIDKIQYTFTQSNLAIREISLLQIQYE